MPITFKCSLCGMLADAPEYALGKEETCGICGTVNVVEPANVAAPVPLDLAFSLSDVPLDYRPKSSNAGRAIPGAPIQADAKAPGVVRAYGQMYSVLGMLGAVAGVAGLGYYFYQHQEDYETAILVTLGLLIAFCVGLFFTSKGLQDRRRVAVYALFVLTILGFIGGLMYTRFMIVESDPKADAMIRLATLSLFFIPPISSSFNNWELLQ